MLISTKFRSPMTARGQRSGGYPGLDAPLTARKGYSASGIPLSARRGVQGVPMSARKGYVPSTRDSPIVKPAVRPISPETSTESSSHSDSTSSVSEGQNNGGGGGLKIPTLALDIIGQDDKNVVGRSKEREKTEERYNDVQIALNKLEADGVDIKKLQYAFKKIDSQADGDGVLDQTEFRDLWKLVFPQRGMDENAWAHTTRMFNEIDADDSGSVTWEEVVSYLDKSRELAKAAKAPTYWKDRIFRYVGQADQQYDDNGTFVARSITLWKVISQAFVVCSIVILMIESLPEMQHRDPDKLPGNKTTFAIESACVAVFTIEFILLMISYPSYIEFEAKKTKERFILNEAEAARVVNPAECTVVRNAKWQKLVSTQDFWIDFLSIVPYYLTLILGNRSKGVAPLSAIRMLRLLRLLRIFRLLQVKDGFGSSSGRAPELGSALKESLVSILFLIILIIIAVCLSSTFMFYVELDDAWFNTVTNKWMRKDNSNYIDAGQETKFQSIPETLWFGVVTLTTVGYGDIYPSTIGGKVVAGITMLCGLIVVAFPITLLTSTFQKMEDSRMEFEDQINRCLEFYDGIIKYSQSLSEGDEDAEITRRASQQEEQPNNKDNQALIEQLQLLTRCITNRIEDITEILSKLEDKHGIDGSHSSSGSDLAEDLGGSVAKDDDSDASDESSSESSQELVPSPPPSKRGQPAIPIIAMKSPKGIPFPE
eukprot:TRINITY_DN5833_c2_g2_i3.p1 TRINITY_DN5833_c2_g2~~TRINITY_DN5833_c2_g2_i3.p1  ORF type:complete len:712 (+),score=130.60 TRINITY_DN5833_c2_g2_i3:181-2316(+)